MNQTFANAIYLKGTNSISRVRNLSNT